MQDISTKDRIIKKTGASPAAKEITSELILPDYLPDVSRLLRTEATLGAINSYASGDAIEYDGRADYTVIYATSDGRIKSVPLSAEFDGTVAADVSGGEGTDALISIDSVSCRLQNPRRLSVRTKLSVGADVYSPESVLPELVGGDGSGDGVCKKTVCVCCASRVFARDENVPVSEDVELDPQDPAVKEIISVFLTPYLYDVRASDGSISYRGDVFAQALYLAASDDGDGAPLYFSITRKVPISGEVVAEGVSDGALAAGYVTVSPAEFRPQANALGENRVIEMDFTYTAHLEAAVNESVGVVSDMYSTECESRTEMKTAKCRRAMRASSFNFTSDGSAPLDDKSHTEVVAASAVVKIDDVVSVGTKALFTGETDVSVILTDGDGSYIGRTVAVPVRAETEVGKCAGKMECRAYPSVIGVSARVDGGEIRCGAEIGVSFIAEDATETEIVEKCVLSPDRPIRKAGASSIVICYPGEGETLWDIAKRYGTTENALREANGLTADSVSGKVIIIPTKK